jgi:uncharacterized DUF497 family protein
VSYPSSPVEVCDLIRMSTNAVFAVLDKFRTHPARSSQTALDEVRANLTRLRREFSDYEPVLDRIAEQISAHDVGELRGIIRTLRKVIDDWLYGDGPLHTVVFTEIDHERARVISLRPSTTQEIHTYAAQKGKE